MYAQLCKRLSKEAPNFESIESPCTFLRLILNICRDKFLNRSTYKEIINHDGPLTPDDEEKKYIAKQKMLGNVKFIGELCKLDMVAPSTLHLCMQRLLEKDSSKSTSIQEKCENMECLCQLIRTCGKTLDTVQSKMLMDQYFDKMASCSNNPKYPSRIRFMLRDVIELRSNNWIPRKVNTTEGPVPIHQLKNDEDLLRSGYITSRDSRNNEREPDSWMNRLPLNLQPGFNDMMFSSLSVSSPTPIIPPYNSQNNYNNRDMRDGGGYRHNNQRNNQNNYNNRYNKHNNQNNYNNSHNNSFTNNMLNHKDLAPRFKRTLIPPNQDSVDNLQMRPAANSLLFKANVNIKITLPLSQPTTNNKSINNNNNNTNNSTNPMINSNDSNNSHHNNNHHNHNNHYQNDNSKQPILQNNNSNTNNHHQNNNTNNSNNLKSSAPASQQQQQQGTTEKQTPVNNILNKEQIVIKPASADKPNKNKKTKGPPKEEILKKVSNFMQDKFLCNEITNINDTINVVVDPTTTSITTLTTEPDNLNDIIESFLEIKVPDKFMKDSIIILLYEILDKSDQIIDLAIEFLLKLKKDNKLNNNALLESFKSVINGMNERESTIPRITTLVATLLSRAVSSKLCNLSDIAKYTENGMHYPLFLLILQQLHKNLGKQALLDIFNESKVNLMLSLPEVDRTKDRMAEILEDRNLSFLYPLLKVQAELWKQIQIDPNPQIFYKWIKDNVESNCYTDPGFVTALMTVLLKYITQETTLGEGVDPKKNPDKSVVEKEKALLEKYCPVLNAFIYYNSDLQLVAIYALQVYCFSVDFPKGMLLRWFTALYELNVIEEESFLRWKEDISDVYPGKGNALFQVNTWLLWLKEAEYEEDEY